MFMGLIAALLGLTGVAAGAFGAHALRDRLAAAGLTHAWETAVLYQLVHAVALLALVLAPTAQGSLWRAVGYCWIGGVLLFSGSLYVLALGGPRWLGPITPLGGAALIAGWAVLALVFLRR